MNMRRHTAYISPSRPRNTKRRKKRRTGSTKKKYASKVMGTAREDDSDGGDADVVHVVDESMDTATSQGQDVEDGLKKNKEEGEASPENAEVSGRKRGSEELRSDVFSQEGVHGPNLANCEIIIAPDSSTGHASKKTRYDDTLTRKTKGVEDDMDKATIRTFGCPFGCGFTSSHEDVERHTAMCSLVQKNDIACTDFVSGRVTLRKAVCCRAAKEFR